MTKNKKTKVYSEEFSTDTLFIATFARNYDLDPDRDLELIKEIHSITTIKHVYEQNVIQQNQLLNTLTK